MTANAVYHLSNVSAGQEFDLTVAEGADVLQAAQAHLEESGLYGDLQHGFYISVYPRQPSETPTTQARAAGNLDLHPTATAPESRSDDSAGSGTGHAGPDDEAILG